MAQRHRPDRIKQDSPDPDTIPARVVLDTPARSTEVAVSTVRAYLAKLLSELWSDPGGFTGKWGVTGNEDWPYELYRVLWENELIGGVVNEDGTLYDPDTEAGDILMQKAILAFGKGEV